MRFDRDFCAIFDRTLQSSIVLNLLVTPLTRCASCFARGGAGKFSSGQSHLPPRPKRVLIVESVCPCLVYPNSHVVLCELRVQSLDKLPVGAEPCLSFCLCPEVTEPFSLLKHAYLCIERHHGVILRYNCLFHEFFSFETLEVKISLPHNLPLTSVLYR